MKKACEQSIIIMNLKLLKNPINSKNIMKTIKNQMKSSKNLKNGKNNYKIKEISTKANLMRCEKEWPNFKMH